MTTLAAVTIDARSVRTLDHQEVSLLRRIGPSRLDQQEIAVLDPEALELLASRSDEIAALRAGHSSIHRVIRLDSIRREAPLTIRHVDEAGNGYGLRIQIHPEYSDAAGARRVPFDVAFLRESLQMLGDGLCTLDVEPLTDLPNRGLVGVRAEIMDDVVQYLPLEIGQHCRHRGPPKPHPH